MHVYNSNERLGDFQIQHSEAIESLNCTLTIARHLPSKANIMHIGNSDPENLFCLSFATPPPDSTGISHILEHCALCGSTHFPVKDPFFSMARRSLCTFMNAFTGFDFTCYPAASQVRSDFYNLLEVYQDAVFQPLLTETSFWQEGVRLERSEESKGQLLYRGIVYNEMKGAFGSGETRLWWHLLGALFPETPYRFESGGHPDHIPELTHARLRAYHKQHYHPSRCLFYFYGNLPLGDHLQFLETTALKGVTEQKDPPFVARQSPFERPRQIKGSYPSGEDVEASGALFGVAWWLCDIDQNDEIWLAFLFEELLLGSDAAPLKRALIEGGHCAQVVGSLQADIPQIPFTLFLKGCSQRDVHILANAVVSALAKIAQRGFSEAEIAAAIHRLELQHREIESGSYPYGLALFWRAAPAMHHGVDPVRALHIDRQIQQLKSYQTRPKTLQDRLRRAFVDNPHRVDVLLEPDADLAGAEQIEEMARLAKLAQSLTEKEAARCDQNAQTLQRAQEAQDNLACLPVIPIDQIDLTPQCFPLKSQACGEGTLHVHRVHTNGFLYIDCLIPLPELGATLPLNAKTTQALSHPTLLRLLTSFWTRVGTQDKTFSQHVEEIAAHSGGISTEIVCFADAATDQLAYFIRVSIKGLSAKGCDICRLLLQTMRSAAFSNAPRVLELLTQHWVQLQHSLVSNGLAFALQMASSAHSLGARNHGCIGGIEYFKAIRDLCSTLKRTPEAIAPLVLSPLEDLHQSLSAPTHLVIACEEADFAQLQAERYFDLLDLFRVEDAAKGQNPRASIKAQPMAPPADFVAPAPSSFKHRRALALPSQVASNALSLPAPRFNDPAFPLMQLIAQLVQHQTLHPEIREKGGAYGSGAQMREDWGAFILCASRDPHIASTAATFEVALRKLATQGCSLSELDEAKRVVIQHLDTPIAPGERGIVELSQRMRGQSHALRALQRKRILSATPKDIQQCCREQLVSNLPNAGFATAAHTGLLSQQVPQIPIETI